MENPHQLMCCPIPLLMTNTNRFWDLLPTVHNQMKPQPTLQVTSQVSCQFLIIKNGFWIVVQMLTLQGLQVTCKTHSNAQPLMVLWGFQMVNPLTFNLLVQFIYLHLVSLTKSYMSLISISTYFPYPSSPKTTIVLLFSTHTFVSFRNVWLGRSWRLVNKSTAFTFLNQPHPKLTFVIATLVVWIMLAIFLIVKTLALIYGIKDLGICLFLDCNFYLSLHKNHSQLTVIYVPSPSKQEPCFPHQTATHHLPIFIYCILTFGALIDILHIMELNTSQP